MVMGIASVRHVGCATGSSSSRNMDRIGISINVRVRVSWIQ